MAIVMLYYINSPGLDVLLGLCACARASVHVRACLLKRCFHGRVSKAFHSCLSFLSSRNTSLNYSFKTPPLLVSGPLIDTQQPTSHYGVFCAPRFCTLSSCIMLPFLALCELHTSKSRFPPVFFQITHTLCGFL